MRQQGLYSRMSALILVWSPRHPDMGASCWVPKVAVPVTASDGRWVFTTGALSERRMAQMELQICSERGTCPCVSEPLEWKLVSLYRESDPIEE